VGAQRGGSVNGLPPHDGGGSARATALGENPPMYPRRDVEDDWLYAGYETEGEDDE